MSPLERAVLVRMRISELRQVVQEELPEPLGDLVPLLRECAQLDVQREPYPPNAAAYLEKNVTSGRVASRLGRLPMRTTAC